MSARFLSVSLLTLVGVSTNAIARLWTPADTNTVVWYDAADASTVLANGTSVTNWLDKSGNDYHLTQTNVLKQPLTGVTLNGLNVMNFPSGKVIGNTSFASFTTTNLTLFSVFRSYNAGGARVASMNRATYSQGGV